MGRGADAVQDGEDPQRMLQRVWRQSGLAAAFAKLAPFGIQVVVSTVAYSTGLGFAQVVGATLRVSCHTHVVSSALGCVGVAAASAFAGHMGRHAKQQVLSGKPLVDMLKAPFWEEVQLDEVILDAVCGTFLFKAFGGEFNRVMPSDLRYPGALAYQSLPVTKSEYASPEAKRQLSTIFRRDGCHHCGSHRNGVIGDHMPPNKLFREASSSSASKVTELVSKVRHALGHGATNSTQSYYAQCRTCSNKQGVLLRHGRRTPIVLHRLLVHPGAVPGVLMGLRAYLPPLPNSSGGGDGGVKGKQPKGQRLGGKDGAPGNKGGLWHWAKRMDAVTASASPSPDDSLFHHQLRLLAANSPPSPSPPPREKLADGSPVCVAMPIVLDEFEDAAEMPDSPVVVSPQG